MKKINEEKMTDYENNNEDDLQEDVGSETVGQSIEEVESDETSTLPNEDIITSLNPDQNFEGEAISGLHQTVSKSHDLNENNLETVGEDIDADWQETSASEENSLAENPTPDQDQVDTISKPWGTDYKNDEELDIEKTVRKLEQERENDEEKI